MTLDITTADSQHLLGEGWCTKLEAGVRGTIRGFIEALLEEELEAALGRARYERARTAPERPAAAVAGFAMRCPRRRLDLPMATATGGGSVRLSVRSARQRWRCPVPASRRPTAARPNG